MDIFTKKRIWIWVVVLLIVLNLLTLSTLWINFSKRPISSPPPKGERERPTDVAFFLEGELGLSEEQARQFEKLRDLHFLQSKKILDEIQSLKEIMTQEMFADTPDLEKVASVTTQIGKKQSALDNLLFSHFRELYSVCKPHQQEKLKNLFHEILRMTGPPDTPQPPGKKPPPKKTKRPSSRI